MTLYILTGTTESGDAIGPYVWTTVPTPEQIDAVFERDMPDDFAEGCCESYRVEAVEVEA